MKRLISSLALTACFLGVSSFPLISWKYQDLAQAQTSNELFYSFYGQKIPLNLRQDTIAVSFKQVATRSAQPLYLQLENYLERGSGRTRNPNAPNNGVEIEVKPLGSNMALVHLKAQSRASMSTVVQQILKQSYVQETLPVLSRTQQVGSELILPNEIIIGVTPETSEAQKQLLFARYNLELIRPLRFSKNRYLVRSKSASGIAVLQLANQLTQATGIRSATPNFIQTNSNKIPLPNSGGKIDSLDAVNQRQKISTKLAQPKNTSYSSELLPLQWHLDSTPKRGRLLPRTDIRATDAWKNSNGGRNVVVAVIDSLIQWDHPDLKNNLYYSGNSPDKLPGEEYGWDFSGKGQGDPDTRLSENELVQIKPFFQDTFTLSNRELIKRYEIVANNIRKENPKVTENQLARWIRNIIRSDIAGEFHGTWSAGVIAANSRDNSGVLGVAPNAQILPVRVFALGGGIEVASLIEAIGYSASRGADVINMSLGGLIPDEGLVEQVFEILDANPKLVIVASAGNENLDGVAFPAAIPGILSVGATNFTGNKTYYSSYGGSLGVVAPGGELRDAFSRGILTTGGTFLDGFWQGIKVPNYPWSVAFDSRGKYVQVQGTSFSAPVVSGVIALMKSEDSQRILKRERFISILKETASYEGLTVNKGDTNRYRLQSELGFGTSQNFPFVRPSGIYPKAKPISAQKYYFGSGLVNADAAVRAVKKELGNGD